MTEKPGEAIIDHIETLRKFDEEELPTYKETVRTFFGGTRAENVLYGLLGMYRAKLVGDPPGYYPCRFLIDSLIAEQSYMEDFLMLDRTKEYLEDRLDELNTSDTESGNKESDPESGNEESDPWVTAQEEFVNRALLDVIDGLDIMSTAATYVSQIKK